MEATQGSHTRAGFGVLAVSGPPVTPAHVDKSAGSLYSSRSIVGRWGANLLFSFRLAVWRLACPVFWHSSAFRRVACS